jgi:hypothetical protein
VSKTEQRTENSMVFVTRTVGSKGGPTTSSESEDIIAVHKFVTDPAKVAVDYALTINLGNFESAKIGVSVTVPCYLEEMNEAYEFAQAWAEERLVKERDMITSGRNGQSPL